MMQATLDYGYAVGGEGWLHAVVDFARPFRMPDFFLLSGLFLSRSINAPWREYLDRKLVHFAYFYLLWLTIQLGLTETGLLLSDPASFGAVFAMALIEPINSLWFVHMLAIFYMVTRLLRKMPVLLVFIAAALLQTAFRLDFIATDWGIANRFFDRYVYFFAGYAAAPWIFSFAQWVTRRKLLALSTMLLWALVNAWFTYNGSDETAGLSLVLGFAGAAAIVTTGSLLAERGWAEWLRYTGSLSIVVYLTYFLPMKVFLKLFSATGIISDVGLASSLITFGAVLLPLLFHRIVRHSWLNFLYQRPAAFRLSSPQRSTLVNRTL